MSISEFSARETPADRAWLARRLQVDPAHLGMPKGHTRALVETLQRADQLDLRQRELFGIRQRRRR